MTPSSILVVVASTARRGAEIEGRELAEALRMRGHEAKLVAVTGRTPSIAVGHSPDPHRSSEEVLGRSRWSVGTHRRMRSLARESDVVVAMGSITLLAAVMAMLGLDRPLVCRTIGDPEIWAGRGFRRWRTAMYLRAVDRIATLSERQHRQYATLYGVGESKLTVVPNSRSPERFRPAASDQRIAARASLGLSENDKVLVFVGSLTPEKRVDLAVAAVAELPPDWLLLVVGEGADGSTVSRPAAGPSGGRVRFLGGVDDVVPVYHAGDVMLLTSSTEGVPGVLIEAGLCGLASVATNVGLVSDVVDDRSTGCLVDDDTPASIARAVEFAWDNRDRMGRAARERCITRFSTDSAIGRWEDVISSVRRR